MADDPDSVWIDRDAIPRLTRWPRWRDLAASLAILGVTIGLGLWDVLARGPIHPHV